MPERERGRQRPRRAAEAPAAAPNATLDPLAGGETETKSETGIATKGPSYAPAAPIGSASTLKQLLERQKAAFASMLPLHVTPEQLIRTVLIAASRDPLLLQCTQASLFEAVTRVAELGLSVSGTLGEAYILAFKNKIKIRDERNQVVREDWIYQATLIPGYKGLAKLARQSGEVARLEAAVVYEKDRFVFRQGSDFRIEFERALTGDRGKRLGAYAYARLKDGSEQAEYMDFSEIEQIRKKSKAPDSMMWTEFWGEGARKTAFRRLAKWLPLSGEKYRTALAASDAEFDLDEMADAIEVNVQPGASKAEGLADRLQGNGGAAAAAGATAEPREAPQGATSGAQRPDEASLEREPGADDDEPQGPREQRLW